MCLYVCKFSVLKLTKHQNTLAYYIKDGEIFNTFIIRHRKGDFRCSTWLSLSLTTSSTRSPVPWAVLRRTASLFHISSQAAFFSWILLVVVRRICLCSNYKVSWWSQGWFHNLVQAQVQPHPDPCTGSWIQCGQIFFGINNPDTQNNYFIF